MSACRMSDVCPNLTYSSTRDPRRSVTRYAAHHREKISILTLADDDVTGECESGHPDELEDWLLGLCP